ncbi:DUF2934 domain-containing protein [Shinella sp. M27]|uniref:DUF2934 domain-containing protein n=1 Tax=Shinella sp. M27 TaxID=3368614 RepID=UPI003B9E17C8
MNDPRESRITARAFDLWQAEGSLDGRSLSHWLQAEKEVDQEIAAEPQTEEVEAVALAGAVNPH